MIKTPLSTMIGGAFWTPCATIIGSTSATLNTIIKALFSVGEQGFAYDPNDLTTMWQDQAKLLPVTGEGQPVWHILDKSGNNNHAFATSSATRPILQRNVTTGAYYLAFDGADDFLVTNNINFTATDKMSLFAGVRKLSDAATNVIVELSTAYSSNTPGCFTLQAAATSANTFAFGSRGTVTPTNVVTPANYPPPISVVLSASASISNDTLDLRANGSYVVRNRQDQGAGNYGNYPLYIGRRGGTSLPFNGHLYGLIGIGRLTTDAETLSLEKLIAKNTGVTLNV